jgi:hypothetical protein
VEWQAGLAAVQISPDGPNRTAGDAQPPRIWLSAYNNDVFGDVPGARVLEEGGHETRGSSMAGRDSSRPRRRTRSSPR